MTRRSVLGALAAGALLLASLPAEAASQWQSRIAVDRAAKTTSDDVIVRFSLSNAGTGSDRVLRWLTPLHGISEDIFEVTRDGQRVPYLGRIYKRAEPQESDYISVGAGQTVNAPVSLSAVYDLAKPGTYSVRYRVELLDASGRSARVASNAVSFSLGGADLSDERAYEEPEATEMDASGRYYTPTFVSCSTTRQSSIKSALGSAQTYSTNSLGYLNAGSTGLRYTTWFGTYSSTRYSTVRSHFSNIDSTIKTKTISFNCGCTDSAYAYVYPTQPYKVYLCNAFWSAPSTGTDSKAGTIIHELSHFNVVAATDDWAYGQSACKSLAKSSPSKAVDNADCHEYFAENTPFQN